MLAERIRGAVQKEVTEPRRIVCLTFTNRAAKEMQKVLQERGDEWARDVTIKTFHALCAYMLRAEACEIGLPADFVVYDDEDCRDLVADASHLNRVNDKKKIQDYFNRFSDAKLNVSLDNLPSGFVSSSIFERIFNTYETSALVDGAKAYQWALMERHALDFSDLVLYTRMMLTCIPEIRQRWRNRFDFIQVDEMQDTHPSEYEIVRVLAETSGNLAMIGDLAQTIYGWRGSMPEKVVRQFKQEFKPQCFTLQENYRATRVLLKAADSFACHCDNLDSRYSPLIPAPDCRQGDNVEIAMRHTETDEARWIGQRLLTLQREQLTLAGSNGKAESAPFTFGKVAILTRTNTRGIVIYDTIKRACGDRVPCITVEQFEYFRRKEVKDALAYLRLLTNPHDLSSMRRIRVPGIGEAALNDIVTRGDAYGLRITDFANERGLLDGDPFRRVIEAWNTGQIVIFDTETTGLDTAHDEVIEIAAQLIRCGETLARFHRFIKVNDVGDSVNIHHISNEELSEKGEPAQKVLADFIAFARGSLMVGHNVGFDIKMIMAHARRVGLEPPEFEWLDTFNTAQRFIRADSYQLMTLADQLHLAHSPSHRGDADVEATVDLLKYLFPLLCEHMHERSTLMKLYYSRYLPFAQQMSRWRTASQMERPAMLLQRVLNESGLINLYPGNEQTQRRGNLNRLISIFEDKDDASLHPETALQALLEYTALAKNTDQLARDEERVMICTVHQAKGLEFDHVFIAGAVDEEFPSYMTIKENVPERLMEEQRLFYVAMTRARKRLFISGYQLNQWEYPKCQSRYVRLIDSAYCTEV